MYELKIFMCTQVIKIFPIPLFFVSERLVQKIQEIKTTIENTAAFHSVCSEWSYQYGNIQDHHLNYCVGNLKVPPFMPLEMQGASAQSVFQESPRQSMSRNDSVQSDVQVIYSRYNTIQYHV